MTRVGSALIDAFRKDDFNVAAFVRDATSQGQDRVGRLTQQLEDCASSLDEELQREIIQCHDELLQNAGSINDLEGQLGDVREVVDSLKASAARVRADILSPFHGVKRRTMLLERMQAVNVLIRQLRIFLSLSRKLRTQMEAPTKDYSKAAHTLHELESVLQESGLERITVLRSEVSWIRETGNRVRRQADEDIRSGLKQGNQITLSVSLQVFFNLQCLWPQLKRVLAEMLTEFTHQPLTGGQNFHQCLELNLQVLGAQAQRIHLLNELIKAKTDPLTNRSFSAVLEVEGISSLTEHFWREAASALKTKVTKAASDRASRKALVAECPKMLQTITEMIDKVNLAGRGRTQILRASDRDALYAAVGDLRNEFLGDSIRRVTEPVEMMLPDKLLAALSASGERPGVAGGVEGSITAELPTSHDLKRYVQLLVAELERSECCPDFLLKDTVRNVRSSILLFGTRLEQVVDSSCTDVRCFDPEARLQLRSPLPMPSAGHARNAQLFGIAQNTLTALKDSVPARFQAAIITQQVQSTLQQMQEAIILPMVGALRRAVNIGCSQLPADLQHRTEGTSPLWLAVSQACMHVNRYYFSSFGSGHLLPHLKDLCSFVIRAFLSAVVLLKPCTLPRRSLLVQDMQSIETMLSSLVADFQISLHHDASIWKEFKRLLSIQSLDTADFDEFTNAIPLHLILAFLVNQLPAEVPTLLEFSAASASEYTEGTLMPLWDGQPDALRSFKAKVAEFADKHGLDPTASPTAAFILSHTA